MDEGVEDMSVAQGCWAFRVTSSKDNYQPFPFTLLSTEQCWPKDPHNVNQILESFHNDTTSDNDPILIVSIVEPVKKVWAKYSWIVSDVWFNA